MPMELADTTIKPSDWTSSITYQSRATFRPTCMNLHGKRGNETMHSA